MKSERIGLVSVLAARAPRVRIIFLDNGRRSVNARSVKLTRSSQEGGKVGKWVLAQCAQGNRPGCRSLERREFRKREGCR